MIKMHKLCTNRIHKNICNGQSCLRNVKQYRLEICAVDKIDTTNRHGLMVEGRSQQCLNMTVIQGIFSSTVAGFVKKSL